MCHSVDYSAADGCLCVVAKHGVVALLGNERQLACVLVQGGKAHVYSGGYVAAVVVAVGIYKVVCYGAACIYYKQVLAGCFALCADYCRKTVYTECVRCPVEYLYRQWYAAAEMCCGTMECVELLCYLRGDFYNRRDYCFIYAVAALPFVENLYLAVAALVEFLYLSAFVERRFAAAVPYVYYQVQCRSYFLQK